MESVHAPRPVEVGPRRPAPDRRLDLHWALAAAALASALYAGAVSINVLPPHGLAVVFLAAAPVCAAFALIVLVPRSRSEHDPALGWFSAGLAVAWVAIVLQLISFPAVSQHGGIFHTGDQSRAALYLVFHLALALGAIAGAFDAPDRRIPSVVVGVVLVALLSVDVIPLPVLLRPDGSYTPMLEAAEAVTAAVLAVSAWLWVRRVGRTAPALRGWVGVALSLSVYDVVLNALGRQRFTEVWWASLPMRVAAFAVLAVGALVGVLTRLRDVESYSEAELVRREGQLRSSLRLTNQLLSSAENLANAVTPSEVADALCDDAVETTGVGYAAMLVSRADRELSLLGSSGYDKSMRAEAGRVVWDADHPGPRALLAGEPVFVEGASEIQARFPSVETTPMRAAAVAAALPIRVRNAPVGVLVAWDDEPSPWTQLRRDVLVGLAAQGGQAIARARAYEDEATAADVLQRALLPSSLPRRDGLTMAARYVPGQSGLRVGGDWYDCVEINEHQVALVVGDVMGKGLRAASLMGQIRTSLRSLAIVDPSPAAALTGLDRLTQDLDPSEIATVVYVLLDTDQAVARVARAGHLPPVLVDPDGHARFVEAGGSPPLGTPVDGRGDAEIPIAPGSLLALYTDGMVEDRATGLDGLPDFVATVESVVAASGDDLEVLASELLSKAATPERSDDIALLLTRFTGGPPAEPVLATTPRIT